MKRTLIGPLTLAATLREISNAAYVASGYVRCEYPTVDASGGYVLHLSEVQQLLRLLPRED